MHTCHRQTSLVLANCRQKQQGYGKVGTRYTSTYRYNRGTVYNTHTYINTIYLQILTKTYNHHHDIEGSLFGDIK